MRLTTIPTFAVRIVVENNSLSLPSGMVSYSQAVSSWNQYADANNLTSEQKQAGLDKLAKGELPEGANNSINRKVRQRIRKNETTI